MQDQIDTLRQSIMILVRSFGLLSERKTFCGRRTFAECHAIEEVVKDENISLNELARRLNVAKSAMSRTVDELVKAGLLNREQDPDDRRYVRIELTDQGRSLHREIEEGARRHYADILSRIPVDKQATVIEGVWILGAAIRETLKNDNDGVLGGPTSVTRCQRGKGGCDD